MILDDCAELVRKLFGYAQWKGRCGQFREGIVTWSMTKEVERNGLCRARAFFPRQRDVVRLEVPAIVINA